LLTIINLRGIRSAGLVFMAPTYAFLATLGLVIGYPTIRLARRTLTPIVLILVLLLGGLTVLGSRVRHHGHGTW
jgi:hypothetical protein